MKTPNANGHGWIQPPRFPLPAICGTNERRLLINFSCEPEVLARRLPPPFRPKLVNGRGLAGICLIRLGGIRPAGLPAWSGLSSENAAHRIAVEWNENGVTREGVYVPRRDTNAWVNRLLGGRLFPGIHQAATFDVSETSTRFQVQVRDQAGQALVRVTARVTTEWPAASVFATPLAAENFFRARAAGWSASPVVGAFDGIELHCHQWTLETLSLEQVASSFFADPQRFPPGTATFDSAFLMRNLPHEWHACGRLTPGIRSGLPAPRPTLARRPHLHHAFLELP
jgi:hypothetical protein